MRSQTGPSCSVPLWLLKIDTKVLHPAALRFWCRLRIEYADKGYLMPSRPELGSEFGVSLETIDRWVRQLRDVGALGVFPQTANGQHAPTEYVLIEVEGAHIHVGLPLSMPPSESQNQGLPLLKQSGDSSRESSTSTSLSTHTEKEGKKESLYGETPYSEGFEDFWALYASSGRKEGKQEAFTWWLTNKVDTHRPMYATIMSALRRYLRLWEYEGKTKGKKTQYVEHAINWLKKKRWLDTVDVPPEEDTHTTHTQTLIEASHEFLKEG